MNKEQIKQYLLDNPNLIEIILENIGCHDIKYIPNKRVQCGLPDGDNNTSVQVQLDQYLSAKIYTRNEFDQYEIKDIYTVVQFIKQCTLHEAIQLIAQLCNINYTYTSKTNISNSFSFIKQFKSKSRNAELEIDDPILPEWYKTRFYRCDCLQYYLDGVNSKSQEKFGVSYDVLDNRVVHPIRNEKGEILSFKGRTCDKDYLIKGIPKFIFYYPCNSNHYLFGMYENHDEIMASEDIYVCEAEKGVMQLDSMGINNAISVNKKSISYIQLNKLIKLKKNIILIFDKDVTLEELFIECRKFKKLCNVYYVHDTSGLLGSKDSPMDRGSEVFNRLITECKFQYKGE